jgi:NADH-quinone oxidoreductase subunit H
LAPGLSFILSLIGWAVLPFSEGIVICDLNLGILYLFAVSALNVYGILFAGWSSNSKYAFLGAIRSAAQMISYEISIGFTVLSVVVCAGSFNLSTIVLAQKKYGLYFHYYQYLLFFIFLCLQKLIDTLLILPEAEAELVSGYNVEYSAMTFALFFLAEYANMLLMSAFSAILFLGGWLAPSIIFYSI